LNIKGNVVLICPQTGKEVRLYEDCLKGADPKKKCEFYKYFGIEGCKIVITCTYDQFKQYRKDIGVEKENAT